MPHFCDFVKVQGGPLTFEQDHVRGAWVVGADEKRYGLAANFGQEAMEVEVFGHRIELAGGEGRLVCDLVN